LGFEVPYLYGYNEKRSEVMALRNAVQTDMQPPEPPGQSIGNAKTVRTTMTAQEAAAKVRNQNRR